MLNSILLLGSCYNKHKKISTLFTIALFLNLLFVQLGHEKIGFLVCNVLILATISFINKNIKNNSLKIISSSFSILIWSMLIDVVCYYMFPLFNSNLNIFGYILNGIIFNFRYVINNLFILISINLIEYAIDYLKNKVTSKKLFSKRELIKQA